MAVIKALNRRSTGRKKQYKSSGPRPPVQHLSHSSHFLLPPDASQAARSCSQPTIKPRPSPPTSLSSNWADLPLDGVFATFNVQRVSMSGCVCRKWLQAGEFPKRRYTNIELVEYSFDPELVARCLHARLRLACRGVCTASKRSIV